MCREFPSEEEHMTEKSALGLGLIGCGDFGRFCLEAVAELPEVRIVGVADSRQDAAQRCAAAMGLRAFLTPEELIECEDVDIVHLATPPSTHEPPSRAWIAVAIVAALLGVVMGIIMSLAGGR